MRLLHYLLPAASLFALALAIAPDLKATPPAGFESIDQEVTIRTFAGTMAFDLPSFAVKPGSRVKLTLVNQDGMQHNLVICEPGEDVIRRVGEGALALGATAAEKNYVPDLPEILFHTVAVDPGKEDVIYFQVPEVEQDYPYICTLPGHWFTMKGVIQVTDEPRGNLRDLTVAFFPGRMESVLEMDGMEAATIEDVPAAAFDIEAHGPAGDEPFGLLYRGQIGIPREGEYRFRVTSDDGVRLSVGGEVVALDDGHHGPRPTVGRIRLDAGLHPVELRYFDSGGGRLLQVDFTGPGVPSTPLTPADKAAVGRFLLAVGEQPRVMRLLMPDASTDAIAVGLLNGTNYCFDATDASVRYGWQGGFLDIGPHILGRGGRVCELLGDRFEVGYVPFPLRMGLNDSPTVQFRGYRRGALPEFIYLVDGVEVTQTVAPADRSGGLIFTFEIQGDLSVPVRFLVDRQNLEVAASAGEWNEHGLTVPAAEGSRFWVSLRPVAARSGLRATDHSGHSH